MFFMFIFSALSFLGIFQVFMTTSFFFCVSLMEDIKAVQVQNSKLEEEIELMEEKLVCIEDERKETEGKLKEIYQLYRNEYDSLKLLNIEYKELEILYSNTQYSTDSSKPAIADNDLTTLKITLR